MDRVAILIVTYNSAAEITACIDAARRFSDAEILVIDNASSDETVSIARANSVRLIANPNNRGFAAAVNQGVRATDAPLLLLLNPDAHLLAPVDPLAAAFQEPQIAAAAGLLLGPDGLPQTGFSVRSLPSPTALAFEVLGVNRLFPRNPVNWHYRCLAQRLILECDVEQPAGAFLMFRRSAWETLNGFDEQFHPIWFEDVDFSARLLEAGFRIRFVPYCTAKHAGAHSIQSLRVESREKYWYGSLLKYAAKHYPSSAFRGICAAVAVGSVFRILRDLTRQGPSGFAVQSAVFRFAVGRFFGPVR